MSVRKRQKQPRFAWFLILLLGSTLVINLFLTKSNSVESISQSALLKQYENDLISKIVVRGNVLEVELDSGLIENVTVEKGVNLSDLGISSIGSDLIIEVEDEDGGKFWMELLIGAIPFLIIGGFLLFMLKSAQGSNNSAMSFGKSRAKLYDSSKKKMKFIDVAGVYEAKEELEEIVDFLKSPVKYANMGAKIPRGVMLFGSPGTGKTLLARAVAGEANVPFFSISGSEFVEMFVGVGASRVRDLFAKAKKNAPCIIFIDEIDAVGRQRGAGLGGGNDEREQTLNQILTEMDGFDNDTGVIVIAATNRPDVLDPALLRPGRFDRRIIVDMPDQQAREEILVVHGRNKPLSSDVDLSKIAQLCIGFSGADLENLMNESAILAAKNGKKKITHKMIDSSIEKVLMGPEKKSLKMSKKELEVTAYHEVGHAFVASSLKNCDPVQKVSIIARGHALGVTWFMPQEDAKLKIRQKFIDEMAAMFGGYASEEIFFGDVSTGPSNDLEKATELAKAMVLKYGMGEKLGPVSYGKSGGSVFLGKEISEGKHYSEETARVIDKEIESLIRNAHKTATSLLKENKTKIKKISEKLLKDEVLSGDEFRKLM